MSPERLRRLEAAEAARELVHRYASVVDAGDAEAVSALFTADGVLITPSAEFVGRAAVRDFYTTRLGTPKKHFVTNVRVTHEADGAVRVESYFLYTSRDADASWIGWGTYDDRLEITEGPDALSARFSHRRITPEVGSDLRSGWPAS